MLLLKLLFCRCVYGSVSPCWDQAEFSLILLHHTASMFTLSVAQGCSVTTRSAQLYYTFTRLIQEGVCFVLQEGTGHAVQQGWVEIEFDNADRRLGVCPALLP